MSNLEEEGRQDLPVIFAAVESILIYHDDKIYIKYKSCQINWEILKYTKINSLGR